MNIETPTAYLAAHETYRSEGIDPYDLLGENKAVAA